MSEETRTVRVEVYCGLYLRPTCFFEEPDEWGMSLNPADHLSMSANMRGRIQARIQLYAKGYF